MLSSAQQRQHTASKQVQVIDTAFYIPQLKRHRRVWIYLPSDYNANKRRHYPVLYLHDAQNVFDDATSYVGEWGVDEFMDSTAEKKSIVVAIDHGGDKRLNEYNPYNSEKFGKGEGALYADFLVNTLKPFIDEHYRTKKGKANTFIAGSSMGGLISVYAILKYPAVFGGAGIFSPAFWVTNGEIYNEVLQRGKAVKAKLFFYAGGKEGEDMVPDMLKVEAAFKKVSKAAVKSMVVAEAQHNEKAWRTIFPVFYNWIME